VHGKSQITSTVERPFLLDSERLDCEALPAYNWILCKMAKSPLHLRDPHGAMIAKPTISLSGPLGGPLSDLRFAVKDLFDVAGVPTAAGSPDWPETRPLPQVHAVIVSQLLDAGATLIGKTITDEISLGILGENKFDGHQKIRPALVVSRVDHQLDLLRQSQVTTAILL
jgi:hypothetical protein